MPRPVTRVKLAQRRIDRGRSPVYKRIIVSDNWSRAVQLIRLKMTLTFVLVAGLTATTRHVAAQTQPFITRPGASTETRTRASALAASPATGTIALTGGPAIEFEPAQAAKCAPAPHAEPAARLRRQGLLLTRSRGSSRWSHLKGATIHRRVRHNPASFRSSPTIRAWFPIARRSARAPDKQRGRRGRVEHDRDSQGA